MLRHITLGLVVAFTGAVAMPSASAASKEGRKANQQAAETVELFNAIKAGQVEVKFIPDDATRATVLVKNQTHKPLKIQMPAAFAAVPILAQRVPAGGGVGVGAGGGLAGGNTGYGGSTGGNNNQRQAMGGGMGMGGMGMGGMGMGGMGMGGMGMMGGGMFNVAADATGRLKVATVCLEHGKRDPKPHSPYELRPIESFTSNQQVIELCRMLGHNEVDQVSAQAAAWHLANGLSWNTLASKVRTRYRTGAVEMYFSPIHLRRAMFAVQVSNARVLQRQNRQRLSPGEKDLSASQISRPVAAP